MTTWTEMTAIEFDASRLPSRKARAFAASAPDTMFPRLMPPVKAASTTPAPQLPGQDPLFSEEEP